jgi:hypothetical protein
MLRKTQIWLIITFIEMGLSRLPAAHRSRYEEEWWSFIHDCPSDITKLFNAVGFLYAGYRMRSALLVQSAPAIKRRQFEPRDFPDTASFAPKVAAGNIFGVVERILAALIILALLTLLIILAFPVSAPLRESSPGVTRTQITTKDTETRPVSEKVAPGSDSKLQDQLYSEKDDLLAAAKGDRLSAPTVLSQPNSKSSIALKKKNARRRVRRKR